MRRWFVPQLGCLLALVTVTATPSTASQKSFLLDFNRLGIVSLKRNGDRQDVEFLRKEGCLGVVTVRFRQADSPWQEASTDGLVGRQLDCRKPTSLFRVQHDLENALSLRQRFHSHDDALVWTLRLRNGGNDPLFGLIAYGGTLSREKNTISVVPRDGVRQRLHFIDGAVCIHITLDRDGFAKDFPIKLNASAGELQFAVENRGSGPHVTHVRIDGLDDGIYDTSLDHKRLDSIEIDSRKKTIIAFPIPGKKPCDVQIKRRF